MQEYISVPIMKTGTTRTTTTTSTTSTTTTTGFFTLLIIITLTLSWITAVATAKVSTNSNTITRTAALFGTSCDNTADCTPTSTATTAVATASIAVAASSMQCIDGHCKCQPLHVLYNNTCLPGKLLGFRCAVDAQCAVRVPASGCVQGLCQCGAGYSAYRRSNCLSAAKVGAACRSQSQCRSSSKQSYCKFSVPRVYGHCFCTPDYVRTAEGGCTNRHLGLGSACSSSRQCSARARGSVCVASSRRTESSSIDDTRAEALNRITAIPGVLRKGRPGASRRPPASGGICSCPKGYAEDRGKCVTRAKDVGESPVSLGQRCWRSSECRGADPHSVCNRRGVCDCAVKSHACSAYRTGCHKNTFQCVSNGRCISSHFVCDGTTQCEDGSDEAGCEGGTATRKAGFVRGSNTLRTSRTSKTSRTPRTSRTSRTSRGSKSVTRGGCPALSFRCSDGTCVTRGVLCDGREDCKGGADEANCKHDCPASTFRCHDGRCLPGYVFCNATPSCSHGEDEDFRACIQGDPTVDHCPFRCDNGRCRSEAVLCSGTDGCGDNSDEAHCTVCACPAG